MADIKDPENTLLMETSKGPVAIEMRPDLAPGHVAQIKELARQGFYDGLKFHRVIDGFMAQTGCPQGHSAPGTASGKKLKAEFSPRSMCAARSRWRAPGSEFRRQPVLHLLRRSAVPEQAIHGVGPVSSKAWRTSTRSPRASRREPGHDRDDAGRRRRGVRRSSRSKNVQSRGNNIFVGSLTYEFSG